MLLDIAVRGVPFPIHMSPEYRLVEDC
jgi:hypothetical protein